jgi:hypothetical protein
VGEIKPDTTEKIILPKNIQREMIKFFIQASKAKNVKENTGREKQQPPLNQKTEEN